MTELKKPLRPTRELRIAYATLERERTRILKRLQDQIESLPDNPRIRRLSERAFVLRFSDLGNNWSPSHHDFKWCYREVAGFVLRAQEPVAALQKIIREERLVYKTGNTWQVVTLHQDVIKALKML